MLLEPWCTKDPKRCSRYIGLLDSVVSLVGLIVLVCLPLMILNLNEEVEYIQDLFGPQEDYNGNYTLVVNITYDSYDCDQVTDSIKQTYDDNLKDLDDSLKPFYVILLNNSKSEGNFDICVHHVVTHVKPSTKVVNDTTMKSILIEAIQALNPKLDAAFIESQTSIDPDDEESSTQKNHLKEIGNDPARKQCITETMVKTTAKVVHQHFVEMSNWLIYSAVLSLFASSILLIFESSWMGKVVILICLVLEVLAVIPLIIVFVMVRNSELCLLQYAGISKSGKNSPRYLQTIIAYVSVGYAVVFKGYCILYLVAFYYKTDKQPSNRVSIATSLGTVHTIRSEHKATKKSDNRHNLIQRLLKHDEGEVDSPSSAVASSSPPVSSDEGQEKKTENLPTPNKA